SAFELVVQAAEVLWRVAVRHEASSRSYQNRQVLNADGTLVLTGTARRALPKDFFAVESAQLAIALSRKKRLLRLQDNCLGVERFSRPPRRTVHLTTSALDTGKRVEYRFAAEIFDRFEADLLFFEIKIRHAAQLWGLDKHGDRRQHEVKVLRSRNQREEHQNHRHMQPPVQPAGCRRFLEAPTQQKRRHQRRDEQGDHDRLGGNRAP